MQPNQQDPNIPPGVQQQQGPSPTQLLPFQVPEYLDLGPITDPRVADKKRKKRLVAAMIIAPLLIALIVIGFVAYTYMNHETPEAKLYRALDSQMQLKSIDRIFTSVGESNQTITVTARTVFGTWDTAKTSLSYKGLSGEQCEQVLDSKHFSLRCHSPSDALKSLGVKPDTWYQADRLPASQVNKYDELELQQVINSPFDIIPIGDISQQDRDRIMKVVEQGQAYRITNARTDTLDGQKTDIYKLSIDSAKFDNLWQSVASTLHLTKPYSSSTYASGVQELSIWVSGGKVVKTKFAIGARRQDMTVVYSAVSDQKIAEPQNVQQFPRGVK